MTQADSDSMRARKLSDAKRALLEKRLRGQAVGASPSDSLSLGQRTGPIPLSYGQERIWFLHQLDPQSPAYNMYNVVRLQGALDRAALTDSFRLLIQRHDVLRSRVVVEDGQPYQEILSAFEFGIPEVVLQSSTQAQREQETQELIRAEIRRPFDLTSDLLLRARLLRLGGDDQILVVTIHHIIFDEWSNELFWRELSTCYRALTAGNSPSLPDLAVQYGDFARWQKRQVEKRLAEQLGYWKQQLAGDLPLLQLPAERPRPAQQTFRGAVQWRELPDSLYGQLKSLNQELSTTMFMSLLAAFQLLLTRYTGQTDILVGTPIANRRHPQTKELIGLFLNTLVMRGDLSENLPFVELVKQVRKTALDAYSHQDLPFEKLVAELQPERHSSHNPIFQVMFVHQKAAVEEIDLPGVTASQVPVDIAVAKFDLTLFVQESERGLSVGLEYNTDLFEADFAERLLAHFQTLVESAVHDPLQPIGEVQLLTAAESQTILYDWNNTATEPLPETCIHQLIEGQAARKPQTIAVADAVGQLSYGELDSRANQLARYLQRIGVGPDVPVGLLLERSIEMIVALLAVLKAGGAYLPLDPTYPAERLAFMLRDSRAPVVLAQEALTGRLPEYEGKTCFIDRDWDLIAEESSTRPEVAVSPDNLAYIIYTSGSTGKPRGVPVSHRNLVHSTLARDYFYEREVDNFLLLSPFSFDSSVAGIFWTLCGGGRLVLPAQRIEQDMGRLAALIAHHEISHTLALPSVYLLLLELAGARQLASLQTVIVAGEVCQKELVQRHYAVLPQTELFNEYGPTEGTVWSTAYRVPADLTGDRVSIGRPIPNTQIYILDRYDQPASAGVPGELCIGGDGVTAGYLNRPELTAEKFTEWSFDGQPPRRLYRTGDRARYLPDGNIEFLGRIDHQVKIRGNRVEPGEIENVLRRMPGVKEAVVYVRDEQLVAYVVPDSASFLPAAWRTYLAKHLPDYMIPASFVTVDAFPTTPNGKLDRKALPMPHSPESSDGFVAPRSETEQILAAIWADVLNLERVGVRDNFFALGGNSLLSIRIFARIADAFQVNLPLSLLFTETTIEQLAKRISTQTETDAGLSLLVPIQPHGESVPFFCVHGLTGDVLWFRLLGQLMAPDQPFYGIQARGLDGEAPPIEEIAQMASLYLSEIRAVQPSGPYLLGGASLGGTVALEMAQQLQEGGEEVALLVMLDHAPPAGKASRSGVSQLSRAGRQFVSNAPHWANDIRSLGRERVMQRARRKVRAAWKSLLRISGWENGSALDSTELLDYGSELPAYRKKMVETHWQAITSYTAATYDQPLLLLQAQAQPLFNGEPPAAIWAELAEGPLTVINVPGSHEGMFKEPHVQTLARELRAQLDAAQSAAQSAAQVAAQSGAQTAADDG